MITSEHFSIKTLGQRNIQSPLTLSTVHGDGVGNFTRDDETVRYQVEMGGYTSRPEDLFFEKAGPRELLFFDPKKTRAAIVTCGGLCPGLNNVIRSAYRQLFQYGVTTIYGIRYGYQGLNSDVGQPPLELTEQVVEKIHREGGSILGSSRGMQDSSKIVDFLEKNKIDILFCVGGDGTQRGALDIAQEVERRRRPISIIGIPKTIDNDIRFISRSFGYDTAIEEASKVLTCAHIEAKGVPNGVGLVKVMGRDAGFIACGATLASQEVNFTLIPEVAFSLDGGNGFLSLLKKRLLHKQHAVIVVAEGVSETLIPADAPGHDKSGNKKRKDVGLFLKERIIDYFSEEKMVVNVKYFDPSYIIRSVPANTADAELCDKLARRAVDAAMAGKTKMLVGVWHDLLVHIPIPLAIAEKKHVDPESEEWIAVHEATGQPLQFL